MYDEIDELKRRSEFLEDEVYNLQREIEDLQEENDALRTENDNLKEKNEELTENAMDLHVREHGKKAYCALVSREVRRRGLDDTKRLTKELLYYAGELAAFENEFWMRGDDRHEQKVFDLAKIFAHAYAIAYGDCDDLDEEFERILLAEKE